MFHIGKRETLVLDNVVATLAPDLTSAVGAIRLDSDTYASFELIASSRTYTGSGDVTRPGTYGQFVPALGSADAVRSCAVLHVASRPDVRTSLGVMNPGLDEVTVRMTLLGIDGKPGARNVDNDSGDAIFVRGGGRSIGGADRPPDHGPEETLFNL